MPWRVGVDEAGYGPNLGPLVVTLTALETSGEDDDLWTLLAKGVRKSDGKPSKDERLVVADSKIAYAAGKGLDVLERTALAAIGNLRRGDVSKDTEGELRVAEQLRDVLACLCPDDLADLGREPWYRGTTAIPLAISHEDRGLAEQRWAQACHVGGAQLGLIRSYVAPAPRFNAIVERWDSKAAVLAVGLTSILQHAMNALPDGPVHIEIDKHGGRNHYAPQLQETFPSGFVFAQEEGRERSRYVIEGLDRPVTVTVRPKADEHSFPVALASMVSKYLREALMKEFNAFWHGHQPGLSPTAGYPEDAKRFLRDIENTMERLRITKEQIWRVR